MNIKQFKYAQIRLLISLYSWLHKKLIKVQIWFLKYFKYHGGTVPVEEYMPTTLSDEFVNAMDTAYAVEEVCKKLNIPEKEVWVWWLVLGYTTNKLTDVNDAELADTLIKSTNKKRNVFNLMLKVDDIQERQVAFKFPGEQRQEFEDWLDGKEGE